MVVESDRVWLFSIGKYHDRGTEYFVWNSFRVPCCYTLCTSYNLYTRFITSIDLSSAFLQIGLKKERRKYTSFLFDSQFYQFTTSPYGFRNSQLL
jgi:hypothetical protein